MIRNISTSGPMRASDGFQCCRGILNSRFLLFRFRHYSRNLEFETLCLWCEVCRCCVALSRLVCMETGMWDQRPPRMLIEMDHAITMPCFGFRTALLSLRKTPFFISMWMLGIYIQSPGGSLTAFDPVVYCVKSVSMPYVSAEHNSKK